jgi:hypothetical protein
LQPAILDPGIGHDWMGNQLLPFQNHMRDCLLRCVHAELWNLDLNAASRFLSVNAWLSKATRKVWEVSKMNFVMSTQNVREHMYQSEWQAFRRHQTRIAVCMAAEFLAFPFFIGLVVVVGRLFAADHLQLPAALCWGALYIFTLSRLRRFPCPRCNKNFFGGFFQRSIGNLFNRRCENCGLQRYEKA